MPGNVAAEVEPPPGAFDDAADGAGRPTVMRQNEPSTTTADKVTSTEAGCGRWGSIIRAVFGLS